MVQKHYPEIQDKVLYRPEHPALVFDKVIVNDTVPRVSRGVQCAAFRKFGLYVYIDSTSNPTTLQVEVEFLDRVTGRWHHYKQGVFAALFWEDGDTALGIYECFQGEVLGRAMRVTLTGVGTEAAAYFTVSIGIDLWD